MTPYEVKKAIAERKQPEHLFIKWWRNEEDFLDFDILDQFVAEIRDDQKIDGFDLVKMEEMWEYVQKVAGTKVRLADKNGDRVVLWSDPQNMVTKELPYNAETLLTIFDAETEDNFIDS
ncbi:MAG TPA: hypothetical protein VIU41_13485 [Geobacteraceae bacterium]